MAAGGEVSAPHGRHRRGAGHAAGSGRRAARRGDPRRGAGVGGAGVVCCQAARGAHVRRGASISAPVFKLRHLKITRLLSVIR